MPRFALCCIARAGLSPRHGSATNEAPNRTACQPHLASAPLAVRTKRRGPCETPTSRRSGQQNARTGEPPKRAHASHQHKPQRRRDTTKSRCARTDDRPIADPTPCPRRRRAQSKGESLLLYSKSFTLSQLQKQEKCVSCVTETAKSEPTMQWYTPEVALLSAGGYLRSNACLTAVATSLCNLCLSNTAPVILMISAIISSFMSDFRTLITWLLAAAAFSSAMMPTQR
mmetsp:Transcript_18675/g.46532  ORF Transcript_18675/g.46532 Transcript_18675/m.46532 type:complete len:228 (-) Transcript_18675:29-712(-)